MKKIGLAFSMFSSILGAIMLYVTHMIKVLLPKIFYGLFETSGAPNRYTSSAYTLDLVLPDTIAIALIVLGIVMSIILVLVGNKKRIANNKTENNL